MTASVRSRLAPTPSGFLHIGNAYNFLLTEALCGQGTLRIRIDDLDAPRVRAEYLDDIFESLQWLGIQSSEGPRDRSEQQAGYSQSQRIPGYNSLLQQLVKEGLVFACNCSRKELMQHSSDGQYPGTCLHKNIALDTADVTWRMLMPDKEVMIHFTDGITGNQEINLWSKHRYFVVRRRDGLPAYHIASLYDDVYYQINTIVRGQDLLSSTAAQLYLARLLNLETFRDTTFYHHPLIVDEQGNKLSKSAGSTSLKALRGTGVSASTIRKQAAAWYEPLLAGGQLHWR